ncbi:putative ester cyclase (plasmid) [Nostoc flagelliforme CCNUN1]|uniref:Putative ester cyclase n=1 Tax=Nostoc flagelliforme CCNUN1 TaxID=2038116 RepID=A0A2K8T5I8_9NOSO|nr:nuclear transport factor 2 family protein [Nostoc flagelliforme]AUB42977.1 putative ester cyclase [Nostoc flagelliforme CCNUN1]
MLTEQNKALVLQFYKAFDDHKMEQALELLAPNFVAHLGVANCKHKRFKPQTRRF